jgi:hypothetical protein
VITPGGYLPVILCQKRLSIPVTGKAGERPLFNNKNTSKFIYLTFKDLNILKPFQDQHKIQLLS